MTPSDYINLASELVQRALQHGAHESEVYLEYGDEFNVSVRKGVVETLTQASSKGLGLRVFLDRRVGFAFTSDFSRTSLQSFIGKALALARQATPDDANGLPEGEPVPASDLELEDPQRDALTTEKKIELARAVEEATFAYDKRVTTTEGCGFSDERETVILANSKGLLQSVSGTSFAIFASAVAQENGEKQLGWWWSAKRFFRDLASPEEIGREAARRSVRMLGARKIDTQKVPVIFDPVTGGSFWGAIVDALDGDNVFKKASFLADDLGKQIASETVTVIDDGLLPKGLASRPVDGEGVPTKRKTVIDRGRLLTYLYDTHTALKVGTRSTGNAVRSYSSMPRIGPLNFYLQPGKHTPEEILASVSRGFYVTILMGFGANTVTGDYSVGAAGLWCENGQLVFPVQEVTIASNMLDMLRNIAMIGNDLEFRSPIASPTFLVAEMIISGR